MELVFTLVDKRVSKTTREEFATDNKSIKRNFIKFCACKGDFDYIFTKEEILLAKKGCLPDNWGIHHILPVSGGGDNSFKNFVILSNGYHQYVHRKILGPQTEGIRYGETRSIYSPDFNGQRVYKPSKKDLLEHKALFNNDDTYYYTSNKISEEDIQDMSEHLNTLLQKYMR